jgi:hypothetical protein
MTPSAEKYLREHVDESNAVKWPEDDAAKVDVAQTLLGMWFVGAPTTSKRGRGNSVFMPRHTRPIRTRRGCLGIAKS